MNKMEQAADFFLAAFQPSWQYGTHVTVNKTIAEYTERTSETVNISLKSVLIGYKM